jgi:hypothetical protein
MPRARVSGKFAARKQLERLGQGRTAQKLRHQLDAITDGFHVRLLVKVGVADAKRRLRVGRCKSYSPFRPGTRAIRARCSSLAAYALRLGATGLTFFDDEAIRLFAPASEGLDVMFLLAVGVPAARR